MLKRILKPLLFIGVLLGVLLLAKPNRTVHFGFYSWKTEFQLNNEEESDLLEYKFSKAYIKVLEIDWKHWKSNYPRVVSSVTKPSSNFSYTPVVFITNQTMLNSTPQELDELVIHTLSKIDTVGASEIQIDCDWTEKSRDNYFGFLRKLKSQLNGKLLSSTLRLHQYKYRETMGIPPVDRVALMIYHTGDFKTYKPENSIYDLKEAELYLTSQPKYPVPMDFALAAFKWYVHYDANDHFVELISTENDWSLQHLMEDSEISGNNYCIIEEEEVIGNSIFLPGDRLKLESISQSELESAAALTKEYANCTNYSVIIYELGNVMSYYREEKKYDYNALYEAIH